MEHAHTQACMGHGACAEHARCMHTHTHTHACMHGACTQNMASHDDACTVLFGIYGVVGSKLGNKILKLKFVDDGLFI